MCVFHGYDQLHQTGANDKKPSDFVVVDKRSEKHEFRPLLDAALTPKHHFQTRKTPKITSRFNFVLEAKNKSTYPIARNRGSYLGLVSTSVLHRA